MARLGEILPQLLVERGIEVAFGIPGVHTLELYRGVAASALRHITPRHEQGAGFMADGYARASGRPAAVLAITGPGLTNLMTPMAQALNCSVPMLVISSNNPAELAGRGLGALHDLADQSALAAGVARWSRAIHAPDELPAALDAAMAQFESARPGPVHIEIATDLLGAEAPSMTAAAPRPEPRRPSVAEVAEIVVRISGAQRPLLLLGGGAVAAGEGGAARELAERMQAPTLLTSNARGLLPPGHRLYAGGWLHTRIIRDLMRKADAVLAIGTEFSDTDWGFGERAPLAFADDALIRVDIDPEQLDRNAAPALGVCADAGALIDALLESLPQRDSPPPDLAALREKAAMGVPERYGRHRPLIDAVWEHLPDAILIGDSTEPAYQGLIGASPPAPRRWWTAATGFGTLGYALPAAIGAKVADPRRPVVALIGDGGAMYTITELAAAVEANAHVIVLVWNNSGYGEIRETMQLRRIKPVGVDLSPVEFQPLARAFGAAYARVHSIEFLRDALKKAVMRPGPTVLELREEYWFDGA